MALFTPTIDTRRKLYCGPTAICAVTGAPASEVIGAFDKLRGDTAYRSDGIIRGVRGTSRADVLAVLHMLGFETEARELDILPGKVYPTLARYMAMLHAGEVDNPNCGRIVLIPHHWVAVGNWGNDFCDTYSDMKVVEPKQAKHRRSHVSYEIRAWR